MRVKSKRKKTPVATQPHKHISFSLPEMLATLFIMLLILAFGRTAVSLLGW
jgi:hypothetical protein